MMIQQETWHQDFEQAKRHFKIADHMAYVTFTLLKENRLMIKILNELYLSTRHLIRSILQYEYAYKRVQLYKDPVLNLKTFRQKIAPLYLAPEEISKVLQILELEKKHKDSPLEFVKKDKFVIMLGDRYETLTIEKIKEFIVVLRKLLSKITVRITKG